MSITFVTLPRIVNPRLLTATCSLEPPGENSNFEFKLNDIVLLTGTTNGDSIAPIGSGQNFPILDLLENASAIKLGENVLTAMNLSFGSSAQANFTVNGVLIYMDTLPDPNGVVAFDSINVNLDYFLPTGNYQFTVNTVFGPIHTSIQSSGSLSVSILVGQVVTGFSIENLDNPSENPSLFMILGEQDGSRVVQPSNSYTLPQSVQIVAGGAGTQGPVGPQGPQGIQGETGQQGPKGDTGAQGTQGDTGAQGIQGVKGDTGAQGIQGVKGDTGAQGAQGVKGDTGAQGAQGEKGDTGAQGIQGVKGDTGEQGPQGVKGDTGAQGAQGVKGDTGAQGAQGVRGDTGEQGAQGVKGDTGAQGVKGDTGAQGPVGPQGEVGPQGPPGTGGDGYWAANSSNPNNIYYNNGFVGIGTNNPSAPLEIKTTLNNQPYILLKGGTSNGNAPELSLDQDVNSEEDAPKITFRNRKGHPEKFGTFAFREEGFTFEYPLGSNKRIMLIRTNPSNSVNKVEIQGNLFVNGDLKVTGRKSFVANHPKDPKKEIVYIALEGGEVGTYWRGTGQLVKGSVVITLPEHFKLVTSETGITVNLTPRDECNGLRIVSATPNKIEIKELNNGTSNAKFDFFVMGLRLGYENNYQPIRDKELEGA